MNILHWVLWVLEAAGTKLKDMFAKRRNAQAEEDGGTRNYVDTNAPKVIESGEITYFDCVFSALTLCDWESPIRGNIAELYAHGSEGTFCLRDREKTNRKGSFVPDEAFFRELQQIVSRYDFARYNGQHYRVSGLPPDFGIRLEIRYASGESVCFSDNQNPILSQEAMEELAALFQKQ